MQSKKKSIKNIQGDMQGLYELNLKALWSAFSSEHISFKLLCLYFFFEYVRPQSLYPVIDILPWSRLTLVFMLLTVLFDKSRSWYSSPLNKQFIVFCFVVIVSGLNAFSPAESWKYHTVMLNWFILYFFMINVVNTERRLFLFIAAYLFVNLKMGQHGTFSWAMRGFSFASWGLIGAPGWFRNSGEFAIQMLVFGSLAISFVVSLSQYWGKYKKWILYGAAATGYITVIGASSRGAQLGLLVIIVLTLLRQKGGFKGIILFSVVMYTLFNFLPEEQLQRFNEMGDDNTSLQRLAYWEVGMNIIETFPILGVGYNNWMSYVTHLYPNGVGIYEIVQLPHNIYIQAASELGYTGLFIFLLMTLTAFRLNAQTRKVTENRDNKLLFNLSYGLDGGLIGFLVAGVFVTVLYYPFYWIQISMIAVLHSVAHLNVPKNKLKLKSSD